MEISVGTNVYKMEDKFVDCQMHEEHHITPTHIVILKKYVYYTDEDSVIQNICIA